MKSNRRVNESVLAEYRGKPCLVCNRPSDPCHIKSVGSGGDDTHENLISLCRRDHQNQHRRGWAFMCKHFPRIASALYEKGWFIEPLTGKLRRR